MTEPKSNVVGPWVEWDEPGPPTRSRLVVDERVRKAYEPGDYRADMRPVTPDGLRAACAAVGLRVVGDAEDREVANLVRALTTEKARAEKAEGELATIRAATEPWTSMVGTEQICNALRGVYAPDGDWRKLLAELSDLRAKLAALTAPVEGEPSEEVLFQAYGIAGGHKPGLLAVAACARQHERARQDKRIAEILHNVDTGIGINEAGPLVYALNARRDEAERAWEDERAELVRTRQETQDKLSEARKELTELRARHQPTEPRATEVELWKLYDDTYDRVFRESEGKPDVFPGAIAGKAAREALTARVRAERPACLVERAVAGRLSVELMHDSAGYLAIVSPSIVGKTRSMGHIPASEVRATLEAMLTEVGA